MEEGEERGEEERGEGGYVKQWLQVSRCVWLTIALSS